MARTMSFRYVDEVLIAVHSASDPDEADWDAYVQYCKQLPKTCRRTLVKTKGGGPNARQRKVLQDQYLQAFVHDKANPMKVAVVTDSAVVRGIVTALNWFNPNTSAFALNALDEALRYLGVKHGATIAKISIEMRKIEQEIGM